MSFEADLALAKTYPILELVRECQDDFGYTHGQVWPEYDRDQKTRCPVHEDTSPSAKAYVATNSVYCWVCGRTWDPPALYAAHFDVPLYTAIRVLLERLGVQASASVTDEDLLALVDGPPKTESPTDRQRTDAWLDSLWYWCQTYANYASHLDAVADEINGAYGMDPPAARARVRAALEWAHGVTEARHLLHPPSPPSEDPEVLFLSGS